MTAAARAGVDTAGSNPANAAPVTKLYTPQLLALAVGLAEFPLAEDFPLRGAARSRTCGSSIELGCRLNDAGCIESVGAAITACAVGQAAAAIFLHEAAGRGGADIALSLAQIEGWLAGTGRPPEWPGISALIPARKHPGRHDAIILPWRAASAALCKDAEPR